MGPFMRVAALYPSCVLPCFTWHVWSSELLFFTVPSLVQWLHESLHACCRIVSFMCVAMFYLECMILDITYA
jgi:hypothetical protein